MKVGARMGRSEQLSLERRKGTEELRLIRGGSLAGSRLVEEVSRSDFIARRS